MKKRVVKKESREELLKAARKSFLKLTNGETISEKEARRLQNFHKLFMELERVFRPSMLNLLTVQSEQIEQAIAEAMETED